jgi:CRP-like cAMP-binding protein
MAAASRNRILSALPLPELHELAPLLETVELKSRDPLWEPGRPIHTVLFPETCMVSMVATMEDGSSVEVGVVGRDGMVGLPILLGVGTSLTESFVQIPGRAMRMPADAFRRRVIPGTALHERLLRYAHAFLEQTAQSAACNRLHSLKQRCARWLLMTRDCVGEAEFPLTQEFLAQMLGVRRPGVTQVASLLSDEGLISYTRGRVRIASVDGLEAAACECYSTVREEIDRALPAQIRPRKEGAGPV